MIKGITDGWPKVLSSLKSLLETGRLKQAEASFQRAHNLFHTLQDREGTIRSLLSLGDLFQKMDDTQRALGFFQQALGEAEQAPESPALRGKVEWKVGHFYETATDFQNAALRYEAGLQHLTGLGPTLDLAQATYQLAGMTFQRGDVSRAEALAREALRIAVFKRVFGLQGHIFLLLSRMADPTSPTHVPFERLGEAVFVLEKIPPSTTYVKALLERAGFYESNRQLVLAQQDAEKALHVANQLKDQDLEGQAHLIFGKILIRDFLKLVEAQKHFETAQKKFSGTGNFKLGGECAFQRGEIERLREDPAAAKPHYQKSLHFLEQALGQAAPGTQEAMQLEMKKQQVELVLRSLG